ncbi:MurR/RpiR family transcriptional regulator [Lactobacillus melliventris]|uniref:MurR/RpiR family transcriptional regulator n=1 Tax=Lactobacillus melliventris TaxID=1218507 RepID=A0A0F4LJQ4_9LACO|nr:MurR/RpiR family transcriptional regulator [Lactobacillus melliventris]KJY57806.1 hypothetical protein JF74_03090 [Lactobacillus melliventris]
MDIVNQLETFHSKMSTKEREATEKILKNLKPLASSSAKEAAFIYGTSTTTLVRLAKRIGLSGYSEFSFQTKLYLQNNASKEEASDSSNELSKVTNGFCKSISKIPTNSNNEKIIQLAKEIHDAKRTFFIGYGYTGLVTDYLKFMFLTLGKTPIIYDDVSMINHVDQSLKKGDLVIVFSVSGSLKQYKKIYKKCKQENILLTIVTMNPNLNILKDISLNFILPTVSTVNENLQVQSIDPQPIFWIFASALTRIYKNIFSTK